MIDFVVNNWATAAQGVLMVLGGFSILAKLTPTKADDAVLDKVLGVIHLLGLTKKS